MIKKVAIVSLLLIWSVAVFVFGLKVGLDAAERRQASRILTKPNYSGQQIFDAVNDYRKSKSLPVLKLDPDIRGLCEGIVDRYLSFKLPEADKEGHPGFEEWGNEKLKIGYKYIGENFSGEFTVDDVMKGWIGSPSHNEALTNPTYNLGCSYAGDYGVVVVMGTK